VPGFRIDGRIAVQAALAAGLAGAAPLWAAAGQGLPSECKDKWAGLEAAAKAHDLRSAAAHERDIAIDPICNSFLSVGAKELMLALHREEEVRLGRAGAPMPQRVAALSAALRYASPGNAWAVHARIGDLMRRLPATDGQPDYAAISLAYDAAVRAIDLAPPSARPGAPEIGRLVGLAYQFDALSPAPVPRRGHFTHTARQINVERTPVPLQFVYDSDRLTEAGRVQAENLFDLLKEEDMPRLRLVGHTDPKGSDGYNDKLSLRRALAIKHFLTDRGYPADRIATEGRGKRDIDKLRIWDRTEFTPDQIHQMLRRVELVWRQ
jgi:outer membrane protein OmpA-like peptidoglycan-associated protein